MVHQVVEIMDLVFKNPMGQVPAIEQLVITEFFRNIDLREMRATSWPVSIYKYQFKLYD